MVIFMNHKSHMADDRLLFFEFQKWVIMLLAWDLESCKIDRQSHSSAKQFDSCLVLLTLAKAWVSLSRSFWYLPSSLTSCIWMWNTFVSFELYGIDVFLEQTLNCSLMDEILHHYQFRKAEAMSRSAWKTRLKVSKRGPQCCVYCGTFFTAWGYVLRQRLGCLMTMLAKLGTGFDIC